MKLITAVIKPFKLDELLDVLIELGVAEITVTDAKVFGRQKGPAEIYRGAKYDAQFVRKIEVKVIVEDTKCGSVVDAIYSTAKTGLIGAGKIYVTPVESVVRLHVPAAASPA